MGRDHTDTQPMRLQQALESGRAQAASLIFDARYERPPPKGDAKQERKLQARGQPGRSYWDIWRRPPQQQHRARRGQGCEPQHHATDATPPNPMLGQIEKEVIGWLNQAYIKA
jgi:hypothetical protein